MRRGGRRSFKERKVRPQWFTKSGWEHSGIKAGLECQNKDVRYFVQFFFFFIWCCKKSQWFHLAVNKTSLGCHRVTRNQSKPLPRDCLPFSFSAVCRTLCSANRKPLQRQMEELNLEVKMFSLWKFNRAPFDFPFYSFSCNTILLLIQ